MNKRKQKVEPYLKKVTKRLRFWLNQRRRHHRMIWTDTETGLDWEVDFVFVAFPGLTTMGYRVEGYRRTEKPSRKNDYVGDGELKEFGTLVISDGELRVVQW